MQPAAYDSMLEAAIAKENAMRILVVDDNADVATMLAELLKLDGHEDVAVAQDGAQALAKMRGAKPDFVLCDLVLGGDVDGYAFARACREDALFRDVRLIAMSGYGGEDDRARAIEAGFDDLLAKPVRFDTLRACMRRGHAA
jgi:CheY-like chemotaxis protein